jgi:sortase (surface protein transpeptidase)
MRRGLRLKSRLTAMLGGGAVAIGGAVALTIALTSGSGQLTGAATQIPSNVKSTMPMLASRPTAAGLSRSIPESIQIPAIHVDAPMTQLGRSPSGVIQVPPLDNHNLAGWFDKSVTPGQTGTSIILGHVDTFQGPSVFFNIKLLKPGDLIEVKRVNGSTAKFMVDGVQVVSKATFPSSVIYGNSWYPGLRLITCGGPFDTNTRQYLDNIVVYSHLIH